MINFNRLFNRLSKRLFNKKILRFHLIFLGLCVIAGIGSALFSIATDKAYVLYMALFHYSKYAVLIYTPTIFVLIAYLLKKYFPYAGGSGLPQGYALDVFDEKTLNHTYSLRTMAGKVLLTFLSIVSGASLGREGPTIQICASIFASIKNISQKRKKILIRIGSGVGVATAFNAPLGGIVFAIEEYIKHCDSKVNVLLLTGIGFAGYFMTVIAGDYSYMGRVNLENLHYSWTAIILAIIAGILCGIFGAIYTKLMILISVNKGSLFSRLKQKYYLITALVFGLLVAILGIYTNGSSFGNGAHEANNLLNHNVVIPWYFALSKALGSLFSVAAGVPGGYFSTSLSIGMGIMDLIYKLFPSMNTSQYYLLGMVGFLAAITEAPITAAAMIMSIVANTQEFALPIIIASLLGSYIASLFGDSVYHQQVLIYIKKDKYHATRH